MTVAFPGDSRYTLTVTVTQVAGWLTVQAVVDKGSAGGHWTGDPQPVISNVDGNLAYGDWTYDFTSSQNKVVGTRSQYVGAGSHYGAWTVTMDHAGTAAEGHWSATEPPAPTPLGIDEITATSMRYQFASAGDGGSPVTSWGVEVATNPAFTGSTIYGSSGSLVLTDLTPGVRYYLRARGQNAIGVGPWSTVLSARTLGGGRRWNGTEWAPVAWRRWSGAAWRPRRLRRWNGTEWEDVG